MFIQDPDSTRSIARKLAREILPEEMDVIAAGAETISLADGQPSDIDHGFIA